MRRLTILSPHRDDAAFSLAISLSKWGASSSIRLRVLNFFTKSAYAPYAADQQAATVTGIREREDLCAIASIHRSIEVVDRDFVDAPLRLGIPASAVCNPDTQAMITEELIQQLKTAVPQTSAELAISPLGLGDHVDHIAVRRATVQAARPACLAFYEDLPYATWTPESVLRERVSEMEKAIGVSLKALIVRHKILPPKKRRIVAKYRSQIDSQTAKIIAGWSHRYGGGERIWIPRNSSRWAGLN